MSEIIFIKLNHNMENSLRNKRKIEDKIYFLVQSDRKIMKFASKYEWKFYVTFRIEKYNFSVLFSS